MTSAATSTDASDSASGSVSGSEVSGEEVTSEASSDSTTDASSTGDETTGGGGMCDTYLQDCPDGEKCMPPPPMSTQSAMCAPASSDPLADGDPCNFAPPPAIDECEVGSICTPIDMVAGTGVCTALCAGSPTEPECPQSDQVCTVNIIPALCAEVCNPLSPACANQRICAPLGGWDFGCIPDAPMDFGIGEPCTNPGECGAGTVCLSASEVPGCTASRCCTEYCDLSDTSFVCSLAGQTCQAWNSATPPPGYENVGACSVP